MKKLFKWLLRIFLTLLILVIVAAVVLPLIIDPNDYKQDIEERIQAQIGRPAHLNGEIKWSVFPWLALTFNDVSIDNAKGFKGKNLAEIQQLSARVKILPLIKKDIEIGKVSIDKAVFNLQVSKSGMSNWQSILDSLDSDQSSESSTSSGTLSIEGIGLSDIEVNYTDAQSNTHAIISKLALNTGKLNTQSSVDIDIDLHINVPDTGLDLDFSTDIIATNLLTNKPIQLDVNELNLAGQLSSEGHIRLDISLEQVGKINLDNDTLSFPEISINVGDANITSNVSAKNISGNMHLSGSYKLATFDMNKFLTELTGTPVVSSDAFDDFSSSGQWSLIGEHLKIDKLVVLFDKSKITGNADIKDLDKLTGTFNIHINSLNIDDFLGDEESSTATSQNDDSDINFGQLTGNIKIDSLLASGTKMQNISIKVKTSGAKLVMDPVKADFYQGHLITAIKVDTKAKSNKVIVEHKMSKIQAGPLLTDLAGSQLLTGIGNLNIDINIDEPFSEVPLKTAHGHIDYRLGNGAIYGVDVFGMMQKGLSLLYPEVKKIDDDGIKKTSFAEMRLLADIDKGIITTKVLKIESPYLKITGDLTIDLINMKIDGTIQPVLLEIPEQLVSDKYKKLLNLPIPVSLSGSLLEPKIYIDPKKLLLATQKKRIDKEKDKLKGKLFDSLFGKEKNKSTEQNPTDAQDGENPEKNKEEQKNESVEDQLKKKLLDNLFGDGD